MRLNAHLVVMWSVSWRSLGLQYNAGRLTKRWLWHLSGLAPKISASF